MSAVNILNIATVVALCFIFVFTGARAGNLESHILERALSIGGESQARQIDRGEAIRNLASQGIVSTAPTFRTDYTDYRLVKGELYFLGYRVVVITEEYVMQWLGCCPNPGIGVIVQGPVSEASMQSFADRNRCEVDFYTWMVRDIDELDQQTEYRSLHCPDEF